MVDISSTVGFQFLYIVLFVILLIEVGVINTLIVGLKKFMLQSVDPSHWGYICL